MAKLTKEEKTKLIKEHLKYSPLGVSVTAWSEKDGVYVDNGQRNTHWTMLYGWTDKGWKIYDSYAPHRKILSFDHNIEVSKRYSLVLSTRKEQLNIFSKILQIMAELLGLVDKPQFSTPPPISPLSPPEPPQPEPSPIVSPPIAPKPTVGQFAEAIQVYEGWFPPSARHPGGSNSWRNKNPGNIKHSNGKFLVFTTEANGFQYLCDYIKRVRRNEHPAYPKDCNLYQFFNVYAPVGDSNFPKTYAVWVSHRIGVLPDYKIADLQGVL